MVNENEFEGAARELGGKAQEALGNLTGDAKTQAEGKWNQAAGQAQRTLGASVDELVGAVKDKPLLALAGVAAASFLVGFLARK